MSTKGRLIRLLGGLLLREATLLSVEPLGAQLRLLHLAAPALIGVRWEPGDKVQVLLPDDHMRTYTPLRWSPDGSTELLVYLQGSSPASRWARRLSAGQPIRFVGPQRSLRLPPGPACLLGDETSLAVAASYSLDRPGQVQTILELSDELDATAALGAVGLSGAHIVRRPASSPRGVALAAALATLPTPSGSIGITGSGALIQQARAALRARGTQDMKVKAYWVEGRAGLD